jgi:WD40 repeat protein
VILPSLLSAQAAPVHYRRSVTRNRAESASYSDWKQENARKFELIFSRIWDATSGECIHALEEHMDPVVKVAAERTGQYLATASHDGSVKGAL